MNRRGILKYALIIGGGTLFGLGLKIGDDLMYNLNLKVEKNLGTTVDLHSHVVVKYEGKPDLNRIAEHCMNIGLDVLVFTNFVDSRYEYLKRTARALSKRYKFEDLGRAFYVFGAQKSFMVIKGQEIPTKQGHILTVGATGDIKNYNDLSETIKEAKDKDAIIIADHPFTSVWGGLGRKNLEEHLEDWDAIEVFNAQNIKLVPFLMDQTESNKLAQEFAYENNLPGVATSDSHKLNEIALSYITFKQKLNFSKSDDIIAYLRKIIKNKEFENVRRYNSWGSFVSWAVPFQLKARLGFYDKKP